MGEAFIIGNQITMTTADLETYYFMKEDVRQAIEKLDAAREGQALEDYLVGYLNALGDIKRELRLDK